jgi:hypothetical protein
VGEIAFLVGAVTERFVGGLAAAAEADGSAAGETEFIPGWVYDLKIAFDEDGAIVSEGNFCWHEFPFGFYKRICFVRFVLAKLSTLAWTDRLRPTTPEFRL